MMNENLRRWFPVSVVTLALVLFFCSPVLASPFSTGATAFKSELTVILLPIASIALIAVGVLSWFGKISWYWFGGVLIGTILVFGSDQIVMWIRGLAGI